MPKLQIFGFFSPFFPENGGQPFSSSLRTFFFSCWTFLPRLFVPPAERERGNGWCFFYFYFLIYCVFVEECVSPPLLKRLVWGSAAVSVTSNPGKSKIKKKKWNVRICKVKPSHHSSRVRDFFTSCSLLVSLPAAQNQCEVLRDGCCRWNAAVFFFVCFFFFGLLFHFLF